MIITAGVKNRTETGLTVYQEKISGSESFTRWLVGCEGCEGIGQMKTRFLSPHHFSAKMSNKFDYSM